MVNLRKRVELTSGGKFDDQHTSLVKAELKSLVVKIKEIYLISFKKDFIEKEADDETEYTPANNLAREGLFTYLELKNPEKVSEKAFLKAFKSKREEKDIKEVYFNRFSLAKIDDYYVVVEWVDGSCMNCFGVDCIKGYETLLVKFIWSCVMSFSY